jgi:hypothetical protein
VNDELRCDCDPTARPVLITSQMFRGKVVDDYHYIQCPECNMVGNSGATKAEAIERWQKGERFSE